MSDYGYGYDDYDEYEGMGYDEDEIEEKGFEKRIQGDEDIFLFKKMDLPGISKNEEIKKFVVSEETKILITKTNRIYRWRIHQEPQFKLLELPDLSKEHFLGLLSQKDRTMNVKNVYLDPKGYHCIIVSQMGNNFYLNFKQSKIRILPKLKGVTIKALCFHSSGTQGKTGNILFSSQNGIISLYKLELSQGQLFQQIQPSILPLNSTADVTIIQILRLSQVNGMYVIILMSTINSIYCITGADDIQVLLRKFREPNQKVKQMGMPRGYQTLLHTCYSRISDRPTSILWTNGNNFLMFKIPDRYEKISDSFLSKNQIVKFAKKTDLPNEKAYQITDYPISIGISDFHYYLLFQECITVISTVTQKIVHVEEFKSLMSDMSFERNTGYFWIYDQRGVTKLDNTREGAEAWKLLIAQKRYKEAYEVCKVKNQNLSYVAGLYADDLFKKKKYDQAALLFSQTSRTFEQIFLKFLQANSPDAREGLQAYLNSWLQKLQPDQKSQRCLLISWLIELLTYELNNLERQKNTAEGQKKIQILNKLKNKQADLQKLLEFNLDVINENLVYLIMQSHGRIQNLINFADKKNNFEMIVIHYLSEENYDRALDYLKNVKDPRVVDVVYKYAHIFFRYETQKTVNLLTKTIKDFKPIKLMPGLMNIPDSKRNFGIQLLKFCVEDIRSKEKSLHNILIFFYATSPKQKIPELISLMKKGRLDFDLDFGLRLFKNYRISEAQIIVYGKMYLYSEAVSLALENNKEQLAKQYADKPDYEDERKKLWIQIAKYYLVRKGKISEVIELTKQSKVIKIQDLLPHFNQNIKIQNFKDQICESLKSYSQEITRLKGMMDSYSVNADQLKNELRMIKNRCIQIDSTHKCQECFKTLFNQEFYIFPCMHGFHRDCLFESVKVQPTFNRFKVEKIGILNEEIKMLKERVFRKRQQQRLQRQRQSNGSGFSLMNAFNFLGTKKEQEITFTSLQRQEEELKVKKTQIDSILAAECTYCGPGIVDTITMPFDNEELRESWKI